MQISGILSTILYILVGIGFAFGINQGMAFALATDMPIVAVESNSMIPTFYKGDLLVLQGIPAESLKIDDIIVYSPSSQATPIVHRIIAINPDGTFQTKGDANVKQLAFEKSIVPAQIHGKEIMIIPYLGWVKISVTEYVLPNIIWIILAGGVIYIIKNEL